jgi:hypothetical protein
MCPVLRHSHCSELQPVDQHELQEGETTIERDFSYYCETVLRCIEGTLCLQQSYCTYQTR